MKSVDVLLNDLLKSNRATNKKVIAEFNKNNKKLIKSIKPKN